MGGVTVIQLYGATWTAHLCGFHVVLQVKVGLVPTG